MRTLSRLFILGMILVFLGCAAVCPPQTVVKIVWTPFGPMTVQTERDTYCEERHSEKLFLRGDGWITLEEYKALVKKWKAKAKDSI